jgi:hypothetical protein
MLCKDIPSFHNIIVTKSLNDQYHLTSLGLCIIRLEKWVKSHVSYGLDLRIHLVKVQIEFHVYVNF